MATLQLAGLCGLRASEARLELAESDHPIALIRRFDRRDGARVPYMSTRTALDLTGDTPGSYSDIADAIRQISSRPTGDLHELWARIVLTILVTNTDDHLKNHGFIYAGRDRWRLSPAFDINPPPQRQRRLETSILSGGSFDASIELALEAAAYFELDDADARQRAAEIAAIIRQNWQRLFEEQGVSARAIEEYRDAIEHADAGAAAALNT